MPTGLCEMRLSSHAMSATAIWATMRSSTCPSLLARHLVVSGEEKTDASDHCGDDSTPVGDGGGIPISSTYEK